MELRNLIQRNYLETEVKSAKKKYEDNCLTADFAVSKYQKGK